MQVHKTAFVVHVYIELHIRIYNTMTYTNGLQVRHGASCPIIMYSMLIRKKVLNMCV